MKVRNSQQGFTILELMIATLVFSVILLIATFSLLQVGRMFYKGVTLSRTQGVARSVMAEIAQNIQFSGGQISAPAYSTPGVKDKICIGNRRYSFVKGRQMSETPTAGQVRHALVVDEPTTNCFSAAAQDVDLPNPVLSNTSIELLQPGMRLSNLHVADKGNGLWEITLRIVSGENDLLENQDSEDANCRNLRLGSQFCAAVELKTTVLKRINL